MPEAGEYKVSIPAKAPHTDAGSGGIQRNGAQPDTDRIIADITKAINAAPSVEEKKLASSFGELPQLKEGYVRLTHITNPELADGIVQNGLSYESQGMISSTARPYAKEEDVEFSSDDPRYSGEGHKTVVIDLPAKEYRLHNNVTLAPGRVDAKYIVGVVDSVAAENAQIAKRAATPKDANTQMVDAAQDRKQPEAVIKNAAAEQSVTSTQEPTTDNDIW